MQKPANQIRSASRRKPSIPQNESLCSAVQPHRLRSHVRAAEVRGQIEQRFSVQALRDEKEMFEKALDRYRASEERVGQMADPVRRRQKLGELRELRRKDEARYIEVSDVLKNMAA